VISESQVDALCPSKSCVDRTVGLSLSTLPTTHADTRHDYTFGTFATTAVHQPNAKFTAQDATALWRRVGRRQLGDSDVITMLAGFRRHLVGKTLINVFHRDIAEIRFVGKLAIIQTFS